MVYLQLIVGSFVPASQKQTRRVESEAEVVNAPQSESSGGGLGLGYPHDHTNNNQSNNPPGLSNMPWR